ncbi:MAG: YitT family protein [Pseudomonadota bacterium]
MPKKTVLKYLKNTIGIACGSMLLAIAWAWFLIPFKITPGGVGGLSQIFFHMWDIPAGLIMLAFNIPLLILGIFLIGHHFAIGTIIGTALSAIFTDLISVKHLYDMGIATSIIEKFNKGKPVTEWAMTDNILLAALAGSILMGIGIGIVFRFRGSTAGTDIPVAIFKKYFNMSITMGYLVIDTFVIILIAIIFKDPNIAIWGIFTLFIVSRICDMTAEGLPYVKGVMIFSNKADEIKKRIIHDLERGVTILHGEGGYHAKPKKVLYCAIGRRQIFELRDIIKEIDPDSFVTITDVSDVIGFGFKSRMLDMSQK